MGLSQHRAGPSGGFRVELGSDKERILLASLALDAGRPVPLTTLIDRLWEDDPPAQARQNTHTYISRLRRRLRRAAELAGESPAQITSRAHTYALETDPDRVDWLRFQRLVMEAGAGDDDRRTADALTGAEGLWRGEALAGLPGVWAASVRTGLEEKRVTASVARLAARLRLGHFGEVIAELSALTGERPGDETLLGQLMLAYYGSGRFAEALRVHQRARQLLMSEFGSLPGAELNRIHRGVLDRVPVRALVRGTAPEPRTTTSRTAAPPGRALPPRNLPHQPSLVGRHSELRALRSVIETAEERPVITLEAVSGMAGVGKSAIAIHIAELFAPRFPDGQIYLDLQAHSSTREPLNPEAALATLLRLIGVTSDQIPAGLEERSSLWRTMMADRRAVIVLDDVAGPEQIRPLLPGGSRSLTVITSRRHLSGLPQALSIPLDVLPADDAIELFRRFAGAERTADVREIDRIVRLCGFLPLAIELVANRFRARTSWTAAILAERLARDPGRLAEIRDTHSEVARAFDLSYRTLTPPQRDAFRGLGLYPGRDFTAEATAALLGLDRDSTERLLEDLLLCHLIREPEANRYRLHDLLREYARALTLAHDPEANRRDAVHRLINFTLHTAELADRLAYPRRLRLPPSEAIPALTVEATAPQDAAAAKAWFECEHRNLLAIEDYAHTNEPMEMTARLAYALAGFLDRECHWDEAIAVLSHAIEHFSATMNHPALSRSLIQLSALQAHTGAYAESATNGSHALAIARRLKDSEVEAEALLTLGMLHLLTGRYRTGLVHFQNAYAVKSVSGDAWDLAKGHNNIAASLVYLGEHERALEHYLKAVEGFRLASDQTGLAQTLNNIGDMRLRRGDIASARAAFDESLKIIDLTGSRYDRATVRSGIADALTEAGEFTEAMRLHQETLQEFNLLGDKKGIADALIGIGEVHRHQGAGEQAITHQLDALRIARAIGASHQEVQALRCAGQADFDAGHLRSAQGYLEAAVAQAAATGDHDEETKARAALSQILRVAEATRRTSGA
ncbi:tetratricopeptide repeat protein [Streptomyces sp. NPDC057638]|uniref:AfsR/SARP family transcriptional regulator n=1 Tax=Streptomyces sp. NPDC057638 TaxID=3346190 RepID=UPI00368FFE2B